MGDHYRPRERRPPAYEYNGSQYRDREPYPPRDSRYPSYGHRSPPRRPQYESSHQPYHHGRSPPYNSHDRGYAFRGNAAAQSSLPQDNFTFRAPGPGAPSFPRADHYAPQATERHVPRTSGGGRGQRGRARGRAGGFVKRPAHTRDILSGTRRETTPEQLQGMNADDQPRFKEVDDVSRHSESDDADLTHSPSGGDDGGGPRKRVKLEATTASAAPRWSNPDPYTALPPPETLGAPKKDIVHVIRKAKLDAAAKANAGGAVKENADFISLNFDDDVSMEMSHEGDGRDGLNITGIPGGRGASPNPAGGAAAPTQTHLESPSFAPIARPQHNNDDLGPPPVAPPAVIIPGDRDLNGGPLRGTRGRKRKEPDHRGVGDILEEWQPVPSASSTPWCTVDHSETTNLGLR